LERRIPRFATAGIREPSTSTRRAPVAPGSSAKISAVDSFQGIRMSRDEDKKFVVMVNYYSEGWSIAGQTDQFDEAVRIREEKMCCGNSEVVIFRRVKTLTVEVPPGCNHVYGDKTRICIICGDPVP
jgi:hypothetical protein